jgi:hypothetical protein
VNRRCWLLREREREEVRQEKEHRPGREMSGGVPAGERRHFTWSQDAPSEVEENNSGDRWR